MRTPPQSALARVLLRTCAVFVATGLALHPAHARPPTIEDFLKLEEVGKFAFDPTGRWLLFEREPPNDAIPDYGAGRLWARGTTAQIYVADLSQARPAARRLRPAGDADGYQLGPVSPSGARVALVAIRQGRTSLEVVDIASGRATRASAAPEVSFLRSLHPQWVSDHQIAFAAVTGERPTAETGLRRYTGETLLAAWRKTWAGREPSFSVVTSGSAPVAQSGPRGALAVFDARDGTTDILVEGAISDLAVSPGGRWLAVTRDREHRMAPVGAQPEWLNRRSELLLVDLSDHSTRTLAQGYEVFPATLAWSPKGALAFFGWQSGQRVEDGAFRIVRAPWTTVEARPHPGLDLASERERGGVHRPERPAWLGQSLLVFARRAGAGKALFTPKDVRDPSLASASWFALPLNGAPRQLGAVFGKVSALPLVADGDRFVVVADGRLRSLAADGRARTLGSPQQGHLEEAENTWLSRPSGSLLRPLVSRAAEGDLAIISDGIEVRSLKVTSGARVLAGHPAAARVIERVDGAGGTTITLVGAHSRPSPLAQLNPHLAEVDELAWRSIRYALSDGRTVDGCLILPPGYQPGRRYPVIVDIYPNRGARCVGQAARRTTRFVGSGFGYPTQLLAARGYIVFEAPNPQALNRTPEGPLMGMTASVLSGIDALVAEGYADPDRIGLYGVSQGGLSSLWLATQTDRFKTVVSVSGWADLGSHYLGGSPWRYFYADQFPYASNALRYESVKGGETGLGTTPWADPMAYIRNSPAYQAHRVTAPVLMIHSDMDFELGQYDEMFAALYRLGKEAEFVRYWGEGHIPSSPANMRDMWSRIFAWYDRTLRPVGQATDASGGRSSGSTSPVP